MAEIEDSLCTREAAYSATLSLSQPKGKASLPIPLCDTPSEQKIILSSFSGMKEQVFNTLPACFPFSSRTFFQEGSKIWRPLRMIVEGLSYSSIVTRPLF